MSAPGQNDQDSIIEQENSHSDPSSASNTPAGDLARGRRPFQQVINESQLTESSSQESLSSSEKNSTYPLSKVFTKLGWTKGKNLKLKCNYCGYKITTNNRSTWMNHALSCQEITRADPNLKMEIQAESQQSNLRWSRRKNFDLQANLSMTKMLIENRAAMRMVESPWFRNWVSLLNPEHKIANRKEISEKYVPLISEEAYKSFLSYVKRAQDYDLSIEFDHWTDNVRRSFLAAVSTASDGSRFLLSLTDVSKEGHSSDTTVEVLTKILEKVPYRKINSIVSDSASACKLAREKMVASDRQMSHVIEHRCIPHFLNLIGQRYCQLDGRVIDDANELSKILNRDISFLSSMREVKARRIPQASDHRWYSKVNMLEGLVESKDAILQCLNVDPNRRDRHRTLNLLYEQDFWSRVHAAISVLKPLTDCIALAEASECSLGEATKALLEYARKLFSSGQEATSIRAINAFLSYFNANKLGVSEMGLMLASYALDRRNKLDYLTEEGATFILRTLFTIARRTGITDDDIKAALVPEFERFCAQRGVSSRIPDHDEAARIWWSRQPDSKLKTLAIRLGNLRASSANTERFLSVAKGFQGDHRTNYSTDTLLDLVRSNIYLKPEKKLTESSDQDVEAYLSQLTTTTDVSERVVQHIPASFFNEEDLDSANSSNYEEFIKLIDFDIVHEFVEDTEVVDTAELDDEAVLSTFKDRLSASKRQRTH